MSENTPPMLDLLEEAVSALRPFAFAAAGWGRQEGGRTVIHVTRTGEEPVIVTVADLYAARDIAALLGYSLWAEGVALDQEYSDYLLGEAPETP